MRHNCNCLRVNNFRELGNAIVHKYEYEMSFFLRVKLGIFLIVNKLFS